MGNVMKILLIIGSVFFLAFSAAYAGDVDAKLPSGSQFTVKQKVDTGNDIERFSVDSDGSVKINNSYFLPNAKGTPGQTIIVSDDDVKNLEWGDASSSTMGVGGSSLTKYIHDQGLFDLHTEDHEKHGCDGDVNWSFVTVINKVFPEKDLGFCIEKDYHKNNDGTYKQVPFEQALIGCMEMNARLPEIVEWKLAYENNRLDLVYRNNRFEWASNFSYRDVVYPKDNESRPYVIEHKVYKNYSVPVSPPFVGEIIPVARGRRDEQNFQHIPYIIHDNLSSDKPASQEGIRHFRCVQ